MKKRIKLMMGLLLVGAVFSAKADLMELTTIADTFVQNFANDGLDPRNYGADTGIFVRNVLDTETGQARGLLRFDLSGLGTNIEIHSVTLRMYKTDVFSGTSDVPLDVYELSAANSDWPEGNSIAGLNPGEASWAQKSNDTEDWAGSAGLSTPGTDYSTTVLAIDSDFTQGLKDFTSTADFATAVSNNLGGELNLFLKIDDPTNPESRAFTYASSENTEGFTAPTLIVDYTVIPEPATMGLLGTGGVIGLLLRRIRL